LTLKRKSISADIAASGNRSRYCAAFTRRNFARLLSFRKNDGVSVEVGAGPGFFKQTLPSVISTDIVWCPWLDAVADAQKLPFQSSTVANIFGVDMLHHLASPMTFLLEAQRILLPGGRLILVEPWVTPFSYFIDRYFHQEDCDLSTHLWDLGDFRVTPEKKPSTVIRLFRTCSSGHATAHEHLVRCPLLLHS